MKPFDKQYVSQLYSSSNKINSEFDKRLANVQQPNHRESLQSRLLERITTKKQKSPEEIYLDEELSSEEDDDSEDKTQ